VCWALFTAYPPSIFLMFILQTRQERLTKTNSSLCSRQGARVSSRIQSPGSSAPPGALGGYS
jgi:hypothetical protein